MGRSVFRRAASTPKALRKAKSVPTQLHHQGGLPPQPQEQEHTPSPLLNAGMPPELPDDGMPPQLPNAGMPPQPQAQTPPLPTAPSGSLYGGSRPPPPSSLSMGARPPPPTALSMKTLERRSAPQTGMDQGGFWTNRGLPGFKIVVPEHKIKHPIRVPETVTEPTSATASEASAVGADGGAGDPSTWGTNATLDELRRAGSDRKLTASCLTQLRALCRTEANRTDAIRLGAFDAVIESLRRHRGGDETEKLTEAGCAALRSLSSKPTAGSNPEGAVVAVVQSMIAYPSAMGVAEHGCTCLWSACFGGTGEAVRRKDLAIEHGAAGAVVVAMRLRGSSGSHLLREASRALQHLCTGSDTRGEERRQKAVASGALQTLASMVTDAARRVEVVEEACLALCAVCAGENDERLHAALAAEVVPALGKGMAGCRQSTAVQEWGCKSIDLLTSGVGPSADARRNKAAEAGAMAAALGALASHLSSAYVQARAD
uniref:RING-type E3 ubiquitin transferase n=1 Tax=Haptolina brevifila TaxID=156173 RepID=A0A7S2JJQ4_9EUKA|mmetsp:Transcript_84249/g.168194  ORF Transcript_84249/g.168194 Transcript_84249/m.168194 type:complete len:487 (+) Transcript_84249:117-1577(+)